MCFSILYFNNSWDGSYGTRTDRNISAVWFWKIMRLLDFFRDHRNKRPWSSLFNLGLDDRTKQTLVKSIHFCDSECNSLCLYFIDSDIATMPVKTFRKTADHVNQRQLRFVGFINGMPNPETDISLGCTEQLILWSIWKLYWLITARDRNGFPSEVYNLHPDDVKWKKEWKALYL